MNYRVLTVIFCKIISINTFIKFIMFFPNFLYSYFNYKQNPNSILLAWHSIILLFLSIVLWVYADKISAYMVKKSESSAELLKIDYEKLQAAAFSVIGLWLLLNAIPETVVTIISMRRPVTEGLLLNYKTELIKYGIEIFLAIFLIIGAGGIVKLIKFLRYAGIEGQKKID